jgi:hypothetical protein
MTMLGVNKQREVELAWLKHEPERNRIPETIRRRLRDFKASLETTAATIEQILKRETLARYFVEQLVRRHGLPRKHLLADTRRMLPDAMIRIVPKDIVDISWLSPRLPLIANPSHPGEMRNCILICHLVAFPVGPKAVKMRCAWSLEVPDHASARFLQRASGADLRAALFEAGTAFIAAEAAPIIPLVGRDASIYLPAGPGVFVASVIGAQTSDGTKYIYARAGTWIERVRLGIDQVPLQRANKAEASVAVALWHWADAT